ncbi:adenosylcobinamide-GDP ribazoletransferase [Lentisphaerota bacterium WC36G]|nr:adenosylcobinamide-GDP ribazoletransferase [Lentisphaerae bacterium WC36]
MIQHFIIALVKAWKMLWEYPNWDFINDYEIAERNDFDEQKLNSFTLFSFPVLGFVIGVAALILTLFFNELFSRSGATLLFTLSFVIGLEILTKGRNFAIIASYSDNLFVAHKKIPESLKNLNDDIHKSHSMLAILIVITTYLFRVLIVATLFYKGFYWWFVVVFILNYASQGYLTLKNNFISQRPIIDLDIKKIRPIYWSLTTLLLLIVAMISSMVTIPKILIAVIIVAIIFYSFKQLCFNKLNGLNGKIIAFVGFKIECAILLIGLLMILKTPALEINKNNQQIPKVTTFAKEQLESYQEVLNEQKKLIHELREQLEKTE